MNYSGGVDRETYRQVRNISLQVTILIAIIVLVASLLVYLGEKFGALKDIGGMIVTAGYLTPTAALGGATLLVYLLSSSMGGFAVTELRMTGY